MTPELIGEVLAWNFMAQTTSKDRINKILRKLEGLLAAADALKAAGPREAGGPWPNACL